MIKCGLFVYGDKCWIQSQERLSAGYLYWPSGRRVCMTSVHATTGELTQQVTEGAAGPSWLIAILGGQRQGYCTLSGPLE